MSRHKNSIGHFLTPAILPMSFLVLPKQSVILMRTPQCFRYFRCATVIGLLSILGLQAQAACPFSPDGAGSTSGTATTDGLLFIRYALGLTAGPALGANATQGGALPAAIASYIADPTNNVALDIDGDGKFSANDAMTIARYLFGFRGDALATGLPTVEFASRYGGPALQTYIDNGCTGLNDLPDPRIQTWTAMNTALVAGNIASAKTYLTVGAQDTVGGSMTQLNAQFPGIVSSYSPLVPGIVRADYAEYWVSRAVPGSVTGERSLFIVIFLLSPDGIWRIDSM